MKKHLIGIKIRIIWAPSNNSLYSLKSISYSIFCMGEDDVFIPGKTSLSKEKQTATKNIISQEGLHFRLSMGNKKVDKPYNWLLVKNQ